MCISPEDGARLCQSYEENVGSPLTQAIARVIEEAIGHGLTVDEVILAIERTGLAPRPSGAYLKAVLKDWIENGVCVHKRQRLPWWQQSNPALRYEQREYHNEDFSDEEFINEARQRMEARG